MNNKNTSLQVAKERVDTELMTILIGSSILFYVTLSIPCTIHKWGPHKFVKADPMEAAVRARPYLL